MNSITCINKEKILAIEIECITTVWEALTVQLEYSRSNLDQYPG